MTAHFTHPYPQAYSHEYIVLTLSPWDSVAVGTQDSPNHLHCGYIRACRQGLNAVSRPAGLWVQVASGVGIVLFAGLVCAWEARGGAGGKMER